MQFVAPCERQRTLLYRAVHSTDMHVNIYKNIEYYNELQSLIILRLLLPLIDSVTECVRRVHHSFQLRSSFRPWLLRFRECRHDETSSARKNLYYDGESRLCAFSLNRKNRRRWVCPSNSEMSPHSTNSSLRHHYEVVWFAL